MNSAPTDPDALQQLIAVVARLRDPQTGCPWDLNQTHASLVPYVLEEAHEVADAIRGGDDQQLQEELGDLLLQVLLHARIAAEQQRFDLDAIAAGLRDKLIRRHPHVFRQADAEQAEAEGSGAGSGAEAEGLRGIGGDVAAVQQRWEAIKAAEQDPARGGTTPVAAGASPLSDRLAAKVRGQPALAAAMTISRKAAAAGFEWDSLAGVWEKVQEELEELRQALASGERIPIQEELGDVLFTLVNVARWSGIDPEEALAGTNRRFLARFARVEAALGGDLGGRSLAELEGLWQEAKARIRAESQAAGDA
jgi:XTP/dITP diphosphohydrolase